MTDEKTPPEIMFLMVEPADMSTYARASQTPYGPDANRVRLEWLLAKMKSVQNTEEKKGVYIPKAGEVKRFLEVNRWKLYPQPFTDNTCEWSSPIQASSAEWKSSREPASVFLAVADDSDSSVNVWETLTHFFSIDQENLFNAIRQCAKIEPSPETVSVPEAAKIKEPDETEVLNAKGYNRGFEDGRKDVNEIKLNWDVFCEIANLRDISDGLHGRDHAFEYAGIRGDVPKIITSSIRLNSDTERMKLIIEKINRIWFEVGVQKGIKHESQFAEVADLPNRMKPENNPPDGKKEIPTNAQLFRYLVRWFGKDCIETEYIRDNIDIYELRSNPKRRGKKIICLARKGKMKLSRWQKIQEPFKTIYGCDLSKAHETYTHPEIEAVEGSK